MNLQNFITESIVQIVRGIEAANAALNGSTAVISPKHVIPSNHERSQIYGYLAEPTAHDKYRTPVQRVDFDVAVYAGEGTETKGGIGLMVGTIGFGSHGKSDKSQSSESRIKFAVPIILPTLK